MGYQTIACARHNSVLVITLDRPSQFNTFSVTMAGELIDALDRADQDDDVRVVVITANGKVFCAGAQLNDGEESFQFKNLTAGKEAHDFRDPGGMLALRLFACTKPVIGAINGPAIGVGATFPLAMDIRIASEHARFEFVFARRGIVMESCSSWFLPRIVGISRALEWGCTGRAVRAEEALESGLVRNICPSDQLLDQALSLADEMAQSTSAVSVALIRQMLWRMMGAPHPSLAHDLESKGLYYLGRSPDAKEGAASFFEKRPPRFASKPSTDMPPFYPWWETGREGGEDGRLD